MKGTELDAVWGECSLVYAYGIGTPFALWAALRYLGTEWSIVEGIAVWGYAMAVWIPVAVCPPRLLFLSSLGALILTSTQALCIIPIPILRWTLVGLAFGSSGWYLVRNVYPVLASVSFSSLIHIGHWRRKLIL